MAIKGKWVWVSMAADARSASFEVDVTHRDCVTVLSVRGEVDLTTAPLLTDAVDAVLDESRSVALIVDLIGVHFFASVGMTVLIHAEQRSAPKRFAVVAEGPHTARPLQLLGLDRTLSLFTDLDSAVAALTT